MKDEFRKVSAMEWGSATTTLLLGFYFLKNNRVNRIPVTCVLLPTFPLLNVTQEKTRMEKIERETGKSDHGTIQNV